MKKWNVLSKVKGALKGCWKLTVKYKSDVAYYGLLVAALCVLGTAAQHYRNREETILPSDEASGISYEVQVTATETPVPETVLPQRPVAGEIVADFAPDELIWSETLMLWQTHPAVDFEAADGEAVLAIFDGTVTSSYNDTMYGNTIVIDHGDGLIVRYASLNTLELAAEGDDVHRGEVISAAGSCLAEQELGVHVHIEAYRDGSPVNLFGQNA